MTSSLRGVSSLGNKHVVECFWRELLAGGPGDRAFFLEGGFSLPGQILVKWVLVDWSNAEAFCPVPESVESTDIYFFS